MCWVHLSDLTMSHTSENGLGVSYRWDFLETSSGRTEINETHGLCHWEAFSSVEANLQPQMPMDQVRVISSEVHIQISQDEKVSWRYHALSIIWDEYPLIWQEGMFLLWCLWDDKFLNLRRLQNFKMTHDLMLKYTYFQRRRGCLFIPATQLV